MIRRFIAMVYVPWDAVMRMPQGWTGPDNSVGFMPVFATREDARAVFPTATIIEVGGAELHAATTKGEQA
jgi:hypothetical protein